jgi:hypothetical protein
VRREADALVGPYPAEQGLREELEVFAAAERQCCSFGESEVEQDTDQLFLRIRSNPDGLAAIAALFRADRRSGNGYHG